MRCVLTLNLRLFTFRPLKPLDLLSNLTKEFHLNMATWMCLWKMEVHPWLRHNTRTILYQKETKFTLIRRQIYWNNYQLRGLVFEEFHVKPCFYKPYIMMMCQTPTISTILSMYNIWILVSHFEIVWNWEQLKGRFFLLKS